MMRQLPVDDSLVLSCVLHASGRVLLFGSRDQRAFAGICMGVSRCHICCPSELMNNLTYFRFLGHILLEKRIEKRQREREEG